METRKVATVLSMLCGTLRGMQLIYASLGAKNVFRMKSCTSLWTWVRSILMLSKRKGTGNEIFSKVQAGGDIVHTMNARQFSICLHDFEVKITANALKELGSLCRPSIGSMVIDRVVLGLAVSPPPKYYFIFSTSHRSTSSCISLLFFSTPKRCPFPRRPQSSKRICSVRTPASRRNSTVRWS